MSKTKDEIQTEALLAIGDLQKASVGISVGVGKTLIGLKHMDKHYSDIARFLVTAPKLSIHKEWVAQAEQHKLSHLIPHMEFTTYLSLPKAELDYDVVYLDECHSLKYSCDYWLNMFKGKIIGLTGTPPKFEKSEKCKMMVRHCPIVYKYITDQAVEDDILNDYEIIVHSLELNEIKNIPVHKNGQTWFASEKSGYDYWTGRLNSASTTKEVQIMRIMRMRSLQELKSKEQYASKLLLSTKDKVIVFADTQEQAERLCNYSCHSNNPESERNLADFKSGKITSLSAVQQLSEGVNIPDLKVGIILHSFGNERKASQKIGRMMRLNPNDKATIHILCYKNTVDETWVKNAISDFDQSKITWS